ncbi:primosomal protein [Microbacterium sp. UNC423CL45Tsu]|uniref:primosomal protein n=1 Tax=Microbacterium sp. UNC423CL45Tsu TaxID=1340436 RepID=UPI001E58F47D|nr:primosomal protein [Microbacterium sp. UNC423CL45Tsu]
MTDEERPRNDGGKPRYSSSDARSRQSRPQRDAGKPSTPRDAERKPYAKRDAEKRPYAPRDGERKPYAARDGERRSYPPRDGERKSYPPRDGERKSYPPRDGERKSYPPRDGERKSYPPRDGERKSYPPRDGERKPYAGRDGQRRSYPPRDGERKSYPPRDGERKSYPPRDGERKSYPPRDGERKSYPPRDGERKSYPPRDGERRSFGDDRRSSRPPQDSDRRQSSAGPEIPDDVTAFDLNGQARNELKTLSKENAEQVARHLAMAAQLIDEDPALAHEHALAASRRAGRIAVVRETVAITAYANGDFALALRELRTYRRISGSDHQIALMVDSERGVGRPDRALEVGRAVDRASLPVDVRVELAIAMSGARLDLGQADRALQELDIPELDPDRAFSWSPALFAARAAVLEELGRDAEAQEWQRRAEIAGDAIDALDADREVLVVEEIEELPDESEAETFESEHPGEADDDLESADDDGVAIADESDADAAAPASDVADPVAPADEEDHREPEA